MDTLPISPVATSITAFIGRTATGPRLTLTRINSWTDYEASFGAATGDGLLDESVRLFFSNGGVMAVVISIGQDNTPVTLSDLLAGIGVLAAEPDATLVAAPDAVRLPADPNDPLRSSDFGQFADALLAACADQGRFAILDVWGGDRATSGDGLPQVATAFGSMVNGPLDRGAAYLPWLATPNGLIPPSGALAGVYSRTDTSKGVWKAPANQALLNISGLGYSMNDAEQSAIKSPGDGKVMNALRTFPDRGPMVWGAQTLDGNSADWRYIPVRRTSMFIEQSIRRAVAQFVFAPNNRNTWDVVRDMASTFLRSLWRQGALLGSTEAEAYAVRCEPGSTMTEQEVIEGSLIVQVLIAMVRPAEFIEILIKQKVEPA